MHPVGGRDPEYYRCLCGTHVHRGAYILSIIGMILSGLGLVMSLITAQWQNAPFEAFTVLLFVGIHYANTQNKPGFYWPYIIVQIFGIISGTILAVLMMVTMGSIGLGGHLAAEDNNNKQAFRTVGTLSVVVGALLLALIAFNAYLTHMVFRAYRYMNEEILANGLPPPLNA